MIHELIEDDLSDDDIAARLAAIKNRNTPTPAPAPPPGPFHYFAPLSDAADEYEHWAKTGSERIYLGIDAFDDAMRGIAPGEMCVVVGYAHSGKTVVVSEVINNNTDKRICWFTPDETRVLVLVKLACIRYNLSAEELESRIAMDDAQAIRMLRETAREHFPKLAVFDDSVNVQEIEKAMNEAEDHWGGKTQLFVFDYADLLAIDSEVTAKIDAIKSLLKRRKVPGILLHQSSRTAGKDGQAVTISSGGYGGEQQAIHLIGVRRKKNELAARIEMLREKIATLQNPSERLYEALADAEYDLTVHENTITLNLVKNKRPPGKLVPDTDFILDARTGRIRPLPHGVPSIRAVKPLVEDEMF